MGSYYLNNQRDGRYTTIRIDKFLKVFDPNKHYLWPISKKEIDLNPNFEQNPGW